VLLALDFDDHNLVAEVKNQQRLTAKGDRCGQALVNSEKKRMAFGIGFVCYGAPLSDHILALGRRNERREYRVHVRRLRQEVGRWRIAESRRV
jgi:hypothetical protein